MKKMKKLLLSSSFCLLSTMISAQHISVTDISRLIVFNKTINDGNKEMSYEDVEGTPYIDKQFYDVQINELQSFIKVRYNAFLDQFETLDGLDTFLIPKNDSFSLFRFRNSGKTVKMINGEFYEVLSKGNVELLKKSRVAFKPEIRATTTLTSGVPARFEKMKDEYYLSSANGLIQIPKNEKELLIHFPEKKNEISKFIKENKIKLNQPDSLVKLANYINSIN